jgi:hypothetical protein
MRGWSMKLSGRWGLLKSTGARERVGRGPRRAMRSK